MTRRASDYGVDITRGCKWHRRLGESSTELDAAPTVIGRSITKADLFGTNPHDLLYRMFLILTSDAYRPQRLIDIFAQLHPGEHFFPDSSPNRIHQLINRFKTLLVAKKIPLSLNKQNGWYRLEPKPGNAVEIVYEDEVSLQTPQQIKFASAFATLEDKSNFTATVFASYSGLGLRTAHRLLRSALAAGVVQGFIIGTGKKYAMNFRSIRFRRY
ncbi:MAG: hypothetical protein AB7T49_14610 [Oligoflexales bacterium]